MKALWIPAAFLVSASTIVGADAPANDPKSVFKQYCVQCHGEGASPTAGVSLSNLTSHPVGENFQAWQKVAGVLDQNRMPPKGLPQPSDEQRRTALAWVRTELT